MHKHTNSLSAKVAAVNQAHTEAIRCFDILKEFFTPYLGKKVSNVDGRLTAKITKCLPELPNTWELATRHRCSEYGLVWVVTARASHPKGVESYSAEITVGIVADGNLISINQTFVARTDYTVEEVQEMRCEYREAKRRLSAMTSEIEKFGEYDFA